MKPYLLISIVFLASTGCSTGILQHGAFGTKNSQQITHAPQQPEDEICENGGKCEYITTKTFAELPVFIQDCKAKKLKPEKCNENFNEMMRSRLVVSYPRADFDYAVLWCKSEPLKCGLDTVQKANVLEDVIFETQEARDRQILRARQQEQNQRTAEALKAWGQIMQSRPQQQPYVIPTQKQINCSSNKMGDTINTQCTGY